MKRRAFIALLGSVATYPLAACALATSHYSSKPAVSALKSLCALSRTALSSP
jgi:hypothetical protein